MTEHFQRRRIDELLKIHGIGEGSPEAIIESLRGLSLDKRSMLETQLIIYSMNRLDEHMHDETIDMGRFSSQIKAIVESLEKYHPYLEMLIAREARKEQLQKAIIEKSVFWAFWTVVTIVGLLIVEGVKQYIKGLK
jgi:hypothetical protein